MQINCLTNNKNNKISLEYKRILPPFYIKNT